MIIAPPSVKNKNRPIKTDSKYLATSLNSTLRELVATEDGRHITKAQAISERLVGIAMFAESNADAISASKLIFDRVLGKAAVQKEADTKEMPKVVIALKDDDLKSITDKANVPQQEIPEEEPVVLVGTEDGKEFLC